MGVFFFFYFYGSVVPDFVFVTFLWFCDVGYNLSPVCCMIFLKKKDRLQR